MQGTQGHEYAACTLAHATLAMGISCQRAGQSLAEFSMAPDIQGVPSTWRAKWEGQPVGQSPDPHFPLSSLGRLP